MKKNNDDPKISQTQYNVLAIESLKFEATKQEGVR